MEKHIFKFGNSSMAIIIPKRWAERHGLHPKSSVSVNEGSAGELVISKESQKASEASMAVSNTTPELLGRWVGLHYIYGTGKLHLNSKSGFSWQQLDAVEKKVKDDCPGYEITNQSKDKITIEDLTNMKEVELNKVISRISFMINNEFTEITQGDPKTVMEIEQRVNRFYMLGIRYVNITQPKDYTGYIGVLNMLELISDNLYRIVSDFKIRNKDIFELLSKQFGLCLKGFAGAGGAIEEVSSLRERTKASISRSHIDKLNAHLMIEITNYIANIAEYGLRAGTPIDPDDIPY
jgi:phosphate uptake regulator